MSTFTPDQFIHESMKATMMVIRGAVFKMYWTTIYLFNVSVKKIPLFLHFNEEFKTFFLLASEVVL